MEGALGDCLEFQGESRSGTNCSSFCLPRLPLGHFGFPALFARGDFALRWDGRELAIQCSSNDCPIGLMNLFLQERTSCPSIEARARCMNRIAKLPCG